MATHAAATPMDGVAVKGGVDGDHFSIDASPEFLRIFLKVGASRTMRSSIPWIETLMSSK